jgi:CRP-like cAMP-binding protein
LGELSFFDRQPRSAAAVALTEVEVLEIGFDQLDKVYQLVPDYMKTIMASVADRLRKANETIKRLQKNVVTDKSNAFDAAKIPELSSTDVLAAAAALDAGGALSQPGAPLDSIDPLADLPGDDTDSDAED